MRLSFVISMAALALLVGEEALSKTYNTPTIDGHVTTEAGDWEADEWAVDDPIDDGRWYPSDPDLDDFYVTWDSDSLYVGITTDRGPGGFGNGYLLFIDTDAQNGITGATDFTNADFYPRRITFSTMGVDVVMGGWNLPVHFDVRHCSDPTNTTPVEGVHTQANPGWQHVEAAFSWDGLFGLGQGAVPPGTTLRFIASIVGGDGSGSYDALPTSSTASESDPATPWDAYTDLDVYFEVVVDADADGVPDEGWPPGGSISGTVTLDDPADTTTVVTVEASLDGQVLGETETAPGGGPYTILLLPVGTYDVTATAFSYLDSIRSVVVETDTSAVEGVDFVLHRVDGAIEGQVALAGEPGDPAVDVTVTAYDAETGEIAGDGPQVVAGGSGDFHIATVLDGTYRVEAVGQGYVESVAEAVVENESVVDVGLLELPVVAATAYAFVDSSGNTIMSASTTVSLPADTVYYYAQVWVEPRDDEGRVAYWDEAAQDSVLLSATNLDPSYPPYGEVIFAGPDSMALPGSMLTADMFDDARAPVLIADDQVEVIRVLAAHDTIEGVLEVGIDPAAPVRLALSADSTTIEVGSEGTRITGQLKDAADNDAHIVDVTVNLGVSGAGGELSTPSPVTDANGRFEVEFSGTVAGTTYVTGTVDEASGYPNVVVDTLVIVLEPGGASLVEMRSDPTALRAGDSATLSAQVVDEWGNAVALGGLSVELTATPEDLVESIDSPMVTNGEGAAAGTLEVGSRYGVIEISGVAARLPVETIRVPVDATIVGIDERAPETDADHNSHEGVDLTILRAANGADTLVVTLDFASNWDGVHLALILDTHGDASGGSTDPFGFPIYYGHDLLPDYAYTYKYASEDYADLRKYDGGQWWHYDFVNGEWRIGWAEGVNAVEQGMIAKTEERVVFRAPLDVLEVAPGDTVRIEAYVMQETEGEKRAAFDSVPHDATHDMVPDAGEWWETATTPVTLSNYVTYVVRDAGYAPELEEGTADPSVAEPGDVVAYTVRVTDTGGGVGDVLIDLTSVGGADLVRMRDDGFGPDAVEGDGLYTAADTLGSGAADGEHTLTVTAKDSLNIYAASLGIALEVDNPPVALRAFADSVGDDHGPNQTDANGDPVEGLYYEYPTNLVFFPGSFDITDVEIFADGDWIVFRVYVDELVNHQDAGAADWGAPQPSQQTCDDPYRTDLNLQKIDIYIDAVEGRGSTSGFPNRYVDIAAVDAWDYGIAVEGWGKWFVESNSSNSVANWTLYKNDSDIELCDNYEEDYIDIRVNRDRFGDDIGADNSKVRCWDIIVCLSSHDGDSNDSNLGGIRWVNANTSEWQIGGGRDGEGGRERDANIMDVAVSPGEGKTPGRTQEEMLDYTTAEAEERFANDQVACVLEASFAVDTSPPVIYPFQSDPELAHVPWVALDGAPAVFWTTITDVTGVEVARFRWHPTGLPALRDSVDMVNLAGDIWAADLSRDELVAATNVVSLNETGNARVIEARVFARDAAEGANEITSAPFTFGIPEPWPSSQTVAFSDTLAEGEEEQIVFQDGTVLTLEAGDLPGARADIEFTLTPLSESLVDVSNIRDDMEFAGVARWLTAQGSGQSPLVLESPVLLTLHYPESALRGLSERELGMFTWVDETERWVFKGGAASPRSNTVSAEVSDLGLFGVFYWENLGVGDADGLAGVLAEPNPFSPNGDGLYDEMVVSFYLGREADHVNIEFYDLEGRLARRLVFKQAADYTGRTPVEIVWDGTDETGTVVPYGVYVMRVEAKFKTEPTYERVNRPVVVIK